MLSFFPLDVLDELWLKSQCLRDFLPTLISFPALSVDPRDKISRSASETDD